MTRTYPEAEVQHPQVFGQNPPMNVQQYGQPMNVHQPMYGQQPTGILQPMSVPQPMYNQSPQVYGQNPPPNVHQAGYGQPMNVHQPMYGQQQMHNQPVYGQHPQPPFHQQPKFLENDNASETTSPIISSSQQPRSALLPATTLAFSRGESLHCPHLVALDQGEGEMLLPLTAMRVMVEVHIVVAAVRLEVTFLNPTSSNHTCIFQLPCSEGAATVTSTTIRAGERWYETMVVAASAPTPKASDELVQKLSSFSGGNVSEYDPEIYRLPLAELLPGQEVTFTVNYLQDLRLNAQGEYTINVPTTVPQEMQGSMQNMMADVVINTGTDNTRWGASSHTLEVVSQESNRVVLTANPKIPQPNTDLIISYSAWSMQIKGSCLVEDPTKADPSGAFCLFLSPPELDHAGAVFGRNISFILDRSGSMYGQPMESAKQALITGLKGLNPNDFFAICAFDHEQEWMQATGWVSATSGETPMLHQATPQNIELATTWVQGMEERGATDIQTPLQQAYELLQGRMQEERSQGYWPRLPLSFLVTDGAVFNEKEMCLWAQNNVKDMRIFTFGIGPYANRYFLKMLAQIGQGYTDVCLYPDSLQQKMVDLMRRTMAPVLTQITVGLPGVEDCELYPFPIPDLFVGSPLVVAGKFSSKFPSNFVVRGRLPTGETTELHVQCFRKETVPVKKIFSKMQLDYLIAAWWLADQTDQIRINQEAVAVSMEQSIPCSFTNTVVYETRPQKSEKDKKEVKEVKEKAKQKRGFPKGLAIGGCVLVGSAIVAAVAFGSIASTTDGAIVGEAMNAIANGDVLSSLEGLSINDIDFSCCEGMNEFCCFDIEGTFGECCSGSEQLLDGIFGNCGSCCGDFQNNISGCFGDCGVNICAFGQNFFSTCTDCLSGCAEGDIVSSCTGCVSNCGGGVADVCGGCVTPISDCFAGIWGSAGDCLGSCSLECGDFCSSCGETLTCCGDGVGGLLEGLGSCLGGCVQSAGGCVVECGTEICTGLCEGLGDVLKG